MNVDPLWIFGASTIAGIFVSELRNYKQSRLANLARRGIGTYIADGTKTEALTLNPDRVVKAAEQFRNKREANKQVRYDIVDFKAWCRCPKCGKFDCHLMWGSKIEGPVPTLRATVARICECGFVWKQWR